jgi:hypothetical protein
MRTAARPSTRASATWARRKATGQLRWGRLCRGRTPSPMDRRPRFPQGAGHRTRWQGPRNRRRGRSRKLYQRRHWRRRRLSHLRCFGGFGRLAGFGLLLRHLWAGWLRGRWRGLLRLSRRGLATWLRPGLGAHCLLCGGLGGGLRDGSRPGLGSPAARCLDGFCHLPKAVALATGARIFRRAQARIRVARLGFWTFHQGKFQVAFFKGQGLE